MATGNAQTPTLSLTSTQTTVKTAFTNFTAGSAGSRLKGVSITTGPTTAPGGTYTVTLYLFDGTNYWAFDQFTLVNTVNTVIADEKLYPSKVIPATWSLYAGVSTTLTAGAAVILTASTVDL